MTSEFFEFPGEEQIREQVEALRAAAIDKAMAEIRELLSLVEKRPGAPGPGSNDMVVTQIILPCLRVVCEALSAGAERSAFLEKRVTELEREVPAPAPR